MKSALLCVACLVFPMLALADATIPTKDIEGATDTDVVGRFDGSFIVSYSHLNFDEISLPTSPLVRVPDKRDAMNNRVHRPESSIDLEGSRTRLVYLLPEGASPLELLRNYQQKISTQGGKTLFECKNEECGGDPGRSSGGGGGHQSLAMVLWPGSRVSEPNYSNGYCAQTESISEQRYAALELANGAGYVSVLAYRLQDDLYCKAFNDRTIAVVDIMARKAMEDKMVVMEPDEMAKSIADTGSVALYGIYFDTAKSTLKPESGPTLDNIARLLRDSPQLELLVVGHTDNVGSYATNQALSEQRASAVIDALVGSRGVERDRLSAVGVSFAAPKASNKTEDGRALNRRVELVER